MASSLYEDFITVSDISELESFSIPKLLAYLKSEFRLEYFLKAQEVLISREEKLKTEVEEERERANGLKKHAEDLEEELRACKSRSSELLILVKKLEMRNRELECLKQRSEPEKYKMLDSRIAKLEKETAEMVELEMKRERNSEAFHSKVGNETNGEVSGDCSLKLNVKEHSSSFVGGVRNFTREDSICDSVGKGSGYRQVEEPPRVNFVSKHSDYFKEASERSFSPKLSVGRSISENVIEISDSDNESEGNSKQNRVNNSPLMKWSVQEAEEASGSSRKEYSSVSTLKRKRMLKVVSSDSEDDFVSASGGPSVSTPKPKQRLEIMRSNSKDDHLNASDGLGKQANLIDPKEEKDDFAELIAGIRKWKAKELKWDFEVDLITSFEKDPILCMKAVCALHRRHNFAEKAMGSYLHSNNRGFEKSDEKRGTVLGKFLLDGDQKGEMKKSVKELEMYDPRGLEDCKRLAKYYSAQLFTIYKNKEDSFFP